MTRLSVTLSKVYNGAQRFVNACIFVTIRLKKYKTKSEAVVVNKISIEVFLSKLVVR